MDDIQEIKSDVKELLQRSAVHNQILAEHKNFSIALQNEQRMLKEHMDAKALLTDAKIDPLIKSHHTNAQVLKVVGAIGIGLVIQITVKYVMSHIL